MVKNICQTLSSTCLEKKWDYVKLVLVLAQYIRKDYHFCISPKTRKTRFAIKKESEQIIIMRRWVTN